MSEPVEMLQINKCVLSKLWYTSLIVYQEANGDTSFSCQNDIINFLESELLTENLM